MFGSLALVAEGLHMSTHAGAILIAALAYTYARKHATESRFVFGTGKLGDLAGFTSAIVLAMIAVLIGYEAVSRFLSPVPIHFGEAIPIAVVGLLVNLASVWLLSGGDHGLVTVIATDMAIVTTTMLMKTRCRRFSRPVRCICRFHLRGWDVARLPHYTGNGGFATGRRNGVRYDGTTRWDATGIRFRGPWRLSGIEGRHS
jgi:Co/Zn/Cd efflux system component